MPDDTPQTPDRPGAALTDLVTAEERRNCPILCIDDEPDNLTGFQMTLRRSFNILTATSARKALEMMAQQTIGVVVTDQRMPGMTGVEFIQVAKDLYPDTVYLLLTGYSDLDAVVAGINTGALSGYIAKPWDKTDVEIMLANAVDRHLLSGALRRRTEELAALNRDLEAKVLARTEELNARVEDLRAANDQLAKLNRLKDEFVAVCSHDLKSPLTALNSYVDLLGMRLDKGGAPERVGQILTSMHGAISQMAGFINQILDLSQLNSGHDHLDTKLSMLDATLQSSLAILRPLAEAKGVQLEVEVEPGLPAIVHDTTRIAQVISNLVTNAVKFTHPGGHIAVRLHRLPEGWQRLEVQDSGLGMRPEVCAAIFTEAHLHRRRGTAGEASTGLGLGICHKLVSLHRGRIAVRSTPMVGSTFTVDLPWDPSVPSAAPPPE